MINETTNETDKAQNRGMKNKVKTTIEIKFNTLLSDERIEDIRELIEDSQGVEILEINTEGLKW